MPTIVKCPQCQANVEWIKANEHRPFCSKRCQLIDLGEWADESNTISQPLNGQTEITEEMLDALEDEFQLHHKFFVEPE